MSNKQLFQEILSGIRSDLSFVKSDLFQMLVKMVVERGYRIDEEIKIWVLDIFLDKVYEVNTKISRVLADLEVTKPEFPVIQIKLYAERLIFEGGVIVIPDGTKANLNYLYEAVETYERTVEGFMSSLRLVMHDKNWPLKKDVVPIKYLLPIKRARYVKARDELEKAKQAVKEKKWEEVLNHLRPAIDLALREKFGFSRIHPMRQFLIDAEKYNLSLPSYSMIYDYFDEASQRIHGGKLHTPWECEKALSFVTEFIDRLDVIDISKADIDEFKRRSHTVE